MFNISSAQVLSDEYFWSFDLSLFWRESLPHLKLICFRISSLLECAAWNLLQERWTKSHTHADNSSNGSPASPFLSVLVFLCVSQLSFEFFIYIFFVRMEVATMEVTGSCPGQADGRLLQSFHSSLSAFCRLQALSFRGVD